MSEVSASQLAAQKRRERILGNSSNRLKLVTGQSEELERTPEPMESPKSTPVTKSQSASSKTSQSRVLSLRVYKWTSRIVLLSIFSLILIFLLNLNQAFIKCIVCFFTAECFLLSLHWIHLRNIFGLGRHLENLFSPAAHLGEIGQYMDLASIFLGLQGTRAELFRCAVVYGLQIVCDFFVFTIIFALSSAVIK